VDFEDIVARDPSEHTGTDTEQLLYVKSVMEIASEEDLVFAERVDVFTPELFYMDVCGYVSPRTASFLRAREYELLMIILREKMKWKMRRPYLAASAFGIDLNPPLKFTTGVGPSYPSGHAAISRFYAQSLALFFEDLRGELFNLSSRIAWSRLQLGVHFLRDIKEGERLADLYFEKIRRGIALPKN